MICLARIVLVCNECHHCSGSGPDADISTALRAAHGIVPAPYWAQLIERFLIVIARDSFGFCPNHYSNPYGDGLVPTLRYCGTPANSDARDKFLQDTISKKERDVINGVVSDYGDWTMSELYQLCHEPGSPWDTCYTGEYGVEIPDSVIRQYYKSEMVQ